MYQQCLLERKPYPPSDDSYWNICENIKMPVSSLWRFSQESLLSSKEKPILYMVQKDKELDKYIKKPSIVDKDEEALDKLFSLCDKLPNKFKSQKEFIEWAEQGD